LTLGSVSDHDRALGAAHALDLEPARDPGRLGDAREQARGVVGADRDAGVRGEDGPWRRSPRTPRRLALDRDRARGSSGRVGASLTRSSPHAISSAATRERVGEADAVAEDELGEQRSRGGWVGRPGGACRGPPATGQVVHAAGVRRARGAILPALPSARLRLRRLRRERPSSRRSSVSTTTGARRRAAACARRGERPPRTAASRFVFDFDRGRAGRALGQD
jgi:hypothetical protein